MGRGFTKLGAGSSSSVGSTGASLSFARASGHLSALPMCFADELCSCYRTMRGKWEGISRDDGVSSPIDGALPKNSPTEAQAQSLIQPPSSGFVDDQVVKIDSNFGLPVVGSNADTSRSGGLYGVGRMYDPEANSSTKLTGYGSLATINEASAPDYLACIAWAISVIR